MVVNNGINIIPQCWVDGTSAYTSREVKNIEGIITRIDSNVLNKLYALYKSLYCDVGTGTTDVTLEDYELESPASSLDVIGRSNSTDRALMQWENAYALSATVTVRNNGANDITITEVGAFEQYNNDTPVMIAREVISPVVIAAGETKSFTITIA